MYRISELAEKVGLSRTTLLYYEKQGLISSRRQSNGYRLYSDQDLQQLKLLQQLQAGGLTPPRTRCFRQEPLYRGVQDAPCLANGGHISHGHDEHTVLERLNAIYAPLSIRTLKRQSA